MGRQLFKAFPVFRKSILDSDEIYQNVTGKSLVSDYGLFGARRGTVDSISDPWPIALVLPSIAVYQIALYDLLVSLGVKPDIVLGHSAGETALLYASGAGTRALSVELSIARGETLANIESFGGTMAALSCSPDDAKLMIADASTTNSHCDVEIACYNSPSAVALSGKADAIDLVLQSAKSKGIFGSKIRTRVPFHSSMMEVCKEAYRSRVSDLFDKHKSVHVPSISTYSTLTGRLFSASFDAEYYWNNTRSPVLFQNVIEDIVKKEPSTIFIEIASHPVLSPYIKSMVRSPAAVLCPARRPRNKETLKEMPVLLGALGELNVLGYNSLDFFSLNGGRHSGDAKSLIPAYPFVQKQFPLYPDTDGYRKQVTARNGPLNHKYLAVNKDTHKLFKQHVVGGEPIMPAAGFIEMVC